MSTAIPPAPPPVPSNSTGGGAPVSVTVVANPEILADLPDGAMLEAQAQARAAKGLISVQTANGPVQLKASGPLPPIPEGATLLFQVLNKNGEAALRLLAINGRALGGLSMGGAGVLGGLSLPGGVTMGGLLTPGTGVLGAPQPGMAQPGMTQAGMAQAGMLQPDGTTALAGAKVALPGAPAPLGLTATIIRPAMAPGVAPAPGLAVPAGQPGLLTGGLPLNLPLGTQITVRIAGIGMPPAETGTTTAPGATPAAATPQLPGQPSAARPGAPPQPGMAAEPASFAPPIASSPPLLSGTVTAQPPGGHAVVQTPVGTLSLPTQTDLPTGTPLTLEVVGKPVPPPPATALAQSKPGGLTAQGWPAFTQAVDVLSVSNQTQALEQLMRVMPQAGPRLAASMAMFAGALRSGEVKSLMPETAARSLEKAGKKELAQKLTADLGTLAEDSSRPVGNGEWRGFTMPFLNGAVVDPIQLFVRATDGEANRKGGTGNDERFVLDLKLSQLGRVQMDGLVRREDKLFDLIIRTDAPLPLEAKRDILGIFNNASELVGTKGTVVFQSGARWVEFPPAPPAPTRIEV